MRMDIDKLEIRLMREADLEAIIGIDAGVTGEERNDYYGMRMESMMNARGQIATSFVAEYDGRVVGFIMGKIYMGEFGIPQTTASLDTIGVHPEYAKLGLATLLLEQFMTNVEAAGVESIQTLVDWKDLSLLRFFNRSGFLPSTKLNLEKKI
jgi:ribosomal protein S18 acetylase RimI-like enzyme